MSLIYKPNQGYWVRTMTAVFVGVLVLAGAGWAWQQFELVDLPNRAWNVEVSGVGQGDAAGVPAIGAAVSLVDNEGLEPVEVASATVSAYEPGVAGRGRVELTDLVRSPAGFEPTDADAIVASGAVETDEGTAIVAVTGVPIFERTYLQAGAAGIVLLVGAAIIYWMVGVRRKSVEFLIATDGEMKKVNWSTRKEITGSTIVVVVATFLITGVLFVIDFGFSTVFGAVGVLER